MQSVYKNLKLGNKNFLISFLRTYIIIFSVIYLAPYIFLGSNNYIFVSDNLDSVFVDFKLLLESGKLFSDNASVIEQPLGGIPRSSMPSEYNAILILYYFFGPEKTYVIVRVLATLIGFFGMRKLLSVHILNNNKDQIIILTISFLYSILPFSFFSFLSVAGMPLVLFSFLQIRNHNYSINNWLIILLFPFFSTFHIYGFFFLFVPFLIFINDLINKKKSTYFFLSIILLALVYILVEYRLFDQFLLNKSFVSNRIEKFKPVEFNFYQNIKTFVYFLFQGPNLIQSFHGIFIAPITLLGILIMLPRTKDEKKKKLFIYLIILILIITLNWADFIPFSSIRNFFTNFLPFNFKRFVLLYPLLWYLALSLLLSHIQSLHTSLRLITISILLFQTLIIFKNHETLKNIFFQKSPNIENFFAKKQFSEIKNYINKPIESYRVASVGLHPSISLYNGFYTADGYFVNYPLDYKKKFRNVISRELDKDNNLKSYYDDWGNRVYLFSSELGRTFNHKSGNKILLNNLEFDWIALYNLEVRYIFSSVKIDISKTPELVFEKKFNNENSAWDIYLYKLNF